MEKIVIFKNRKTGRCSVFSPKKNKSSSIQVNAAYVLVNLYDLTVITYQDAEDYTRLKQLEVANYNSGYNQGGLFA